MRRSRTLNPGKLLACRARLKKETHVLKLQTHVQENVKLNPLPIPRHFYSLPHWKPCKPGAERRLQYPLALDAKAS